MNILGLDLARKTGFAHSDNHAKPTWGSFELPGFDDLSLQKTMGSIYAAVISLVRENEIEGVVLEAPLTGVYRKNSRGISTPTSTHGTRVLTMLSGAAQAGAYNGGAKTFWIPEPHHWRKQVLGIGFPENPKASARRYCQMVFQIDVHDDDAAEAVCLLSFGHAQAKLI